MEGREILLVFAGKAHLISPPICYHFFLGAAAAGRAYKRARARKK
jgi:hypothetical protein